MSSLHNKRVDNESHALDHDGKIDHVHVAHPSHHSFSNEGYKEGRQRSDKECVT